MEDPHCWSTPAQESACILSDDYWAIREGQKKKKQISAICGVGESAWRGENSTHVECITLKEA